MNQSAPFPLVLRVLGILVVTVLPFASFVSSQEPRVENREQRFLDLRTSEIELRLAESEAQRAERLFGEGLISEAELLRARASSDKAKLGFQDSALRLINTRPRLTVRQALKIQQADGRRSVRLSLVNLSSSISEAELGLLAESGATDRFLKEVGSQRLRDVFVSLRDSGAASSGNAEPLRGATIALPLEHHLAELRPQEAKTLEFELLRDVNSVLVHISSAGQVQELDLHLQQARTTRALEMTSVQDAQEAELGESATYDLLLSRAGFGGRSFQLKALNVPRQLSYHFVDPDSEARLTQITFPAGVGERRLVLQIFLPSRADSALPLDRPVEFWAVALGDGEDGALEKESEVSREELVSSGAGFVRLTIRPRGVGRIEMIAPTLYSEVTAGETLESEIFIANQGSRQVENIRILADGPLGWRVEAEPSGFSQLAPGSQVAIRLLAEPPAGAPIGDYELHLKGEAFSSNRQIETTGKVFRVGIKASSRPWLTFALISSFLALVAGVVGFGIRLTRR